MISVEKSRETSSAAWAEAKRQSFCVRKTGVLRDRCVERLFKVPGLGELEGRCRREEREGRKSGEKRGLLGRAVLGVF